MSRRLVTGTAVVGVTLMLLTEVCWGVLFWFKCYRVLNEALLRAEDLELDWPAITFALQPGGICNGML